MNRRNLLAAAAASAMLPGATRAFQGLTVPATAATHPDMSPPLDAEPVQASEQSVQGDDLDARLFTACVAAVAARDAIKATPLGQEDEVWGALTDKWADARGVVTDSGARTLAGCMAKARILLLEMNGFDPESGDPDQRLAWRLAHDVLLSAV